jgi:hypothetical protein
MGVSDWSVPRKQSCPEASFCWLRSVMFVAVTVAQFWAEAGETRAASRERERRMRFIEL